ncbi:hypothetical protein SpAn4DRAFT_3952 [Sporomusa ovata]|uniref:Uncharacterized protein n=1 Tax=Sporomusa ovata TaxID=2378 RepID=A0A0U1KVI9_9FIRM|nr:hypothetical protein SpAn4DRAFT_3952 [Sporomusa ovata]
MCTFNISFTNLQIYVGNAVIVGGTNDTAVLTAINLAASVRRRWVWVAEK